MVLLFGVAVWCCCLVRFLSMVCTPGQIGCTLSQLQVGAVVSPMYAPYFSGTLAPRCLPPRPPLQFVPFRDFHGEGDDLRLAEHTLAEIPAQLSSYLALSGVNIPRPDSGMTYCTPLLAPSWDGTAASCARACRVVSFPLALACRCFVSNNFVMCEPHSWGHVSYSSPRCWWYEAYITGIGTHMVCGGGGRG